MFRFWNAFKNSYLVTNPFPSLSILLNKSANDELFFSNISYKAVYGLLYYCCLLAFS